MSYIFPSKLVRERFNLQFEFLDELEWGETIEEWSVDVTTLVGVDTSPNLLKYRQAVRVGTVVSQQIYRGVPGVIYQITANARGSTGGQYKKQGKLAILPDDAILPPINALFLTSRPYPVEAGDALTTGIVPDDGRIAILLISDSGFIQTNIVPVVGNLDEIVVSYDIPPEWIATTLAPVVGQLFSALKTYSIPAEWISTTLVPVTGVLDDVAINYTCPAEWLATTITPLSGTLV